jgi:hypothetical protein
LPLSGSWGCDRVARKCRACCSDCVERIVFAAQPSLTAASAADLVQSLLMSDEVAGKPGPVMAGSLDRPHAHARRVLLGETHRRRVAATVRADRLLRDQRARWRGDDRERVLVAVSVDTHDVIQFVCKHPDRSSSSQGPVCRSGAGKPARQVCDGSRPQGGQAPDQADSGRQTGAAVHTRTDHRKARTWRPDA